MTVSKGISEIDLSTPLSMRVYKGSVTLKKS
jgi:hypothetical protein